MKISLWAGDITEAPAEVICTSTNPRLSLMMGTGGSVRERGGWEILRECEAIVALSLQDSLPAGSAHITRAGSLPYKAIIHCVASDASHRSSEAIVERCVRSALAKAEAIACRTLAMPAFATGHAHLKFDRVLEAMLKVLRGADSSLQEVLIVVNDEEQAAEARQLLRS